MRLKLPKIFSLKSPEDAMIASIRAFASDGLPPDEYIKQRVADGIAAYRAAGNAARARYLGMRCTGVVGGAAVPVLINVTFPYHGYITTGVSLIVAACMALEGVLHYRDQWKNYASTAASLEQEFFALKARTTPYDVYTVDNTDAAFTEFVRRVESVIANEITSTLSVMATSIQLTAPVVPSETQNDTEN